MARSELDQLSCALIQRMVLEVDDDESADSAFTTAWQDLKDAAPDGVGSLAAMAELQMRGWIRVRNAKKASEPVRDPRVMNITAGGRAAAADCDAAGS